MIYATSLIYARWVDFGFHMGTLGSMLIVCGLLSISLTFLLRSSLSIAFQPSLVPFPAINLSPLHTSPFVSFLTAVLSTSIPCVYHHIGVLYLASQYCICVQTLLFRHRTLNILCSLPSVYSGPDRPVHVIFVHKTRHR